MSNAIPFKNLYDLVRVVSGNDDLDLGAEILPDTRISVLLKTAVLTLPTYSSVYPQLSAELDVVNGWQFFVTAAATDPVPDAVVQAVVHVAAHKYFSGIGHKVGVEITEAFLCKCSENFTGMAITSA